MGIKQKIKNFYKDHEVACKLAGAAIGGAAVIGSGYLISKTIKKCDEERKILDQKAQNAATEFVTAINSYDERKARIREEYAEQFKQLEDFSKTLNIPDDMSAIIAGPNSYFGDEAKKICYLEGNYGEFYTSGNDEES